MDIGWSLTRVDSQRTVIQTMMFWVPIVILEIGLGMASLLLPYNIVPFTIVAITLLAFIAILGKKELGFLLIIVAVFIPYTAFLYFHTEWVVIADDLSLLLFVVFFTYIRWSLSWVLVKGETHREKNPIEILLFIFIVWAMITLLWTPNLPHGLILWIKLISIFLILYLSIRMINSARALNIAIWTFIVMGLIDTLIVYFSVSVLKTMMLYEEQFWGDLYLHLYFGPQFVRGAGFGGPNRTATILNLVILLTLGKVLITENRRVKYLLSLLLPFMLMAQLLTMSRGGLFALISGTTFFLFFAPRVKERFFRNLTLFFAIVLFFYILIFTSGILETRLGYERITRAVSPETTEMTSLGRRFGFWTDGFNLFKETYGLGFGIGGFQHYLKGVPHAHSLYFSALFDLGIVGFSLFALMIFVVLKDSFSIVSKMNKEEAKIIALAFISGIIALLVHGLVDFTYMHPELWLLIGMLMAQGGLDNAHEDRY